MKQDFFFSKTHINMESDSLFAGSVARAHSHTHTLARTYAHKHTRAQQAVHTFKIAKHVTLCNISSSTSFFFLDIYGYFLKDFDES